MPSTDYKHFLNHYDMIIKNDGDLRFPNAFVKYSMGEKNIPETSSPTSFTTRFIGSLLDLQI